MKTDAMANRTNLRLQPAMEYLTTYGLALLIIVIAVVMLYIFVVVPSASAPTICTFNSGASCNDVILESNTVGASAVLLISNAQPYPIANGTDDSCP